MNLAIETLNLWGAHASRFAWPMLWQSSLLIGLLFALDLLLRRKLRAAVRYGLWLVVLLKLVLPPTLAFPTGFGWWLQPSPPAAAKASPASLVVSYGPALDAGLRVPAVPVAPPSPPRPQLSAAAWALLGSGAVSLGLLAWMLVRWRQVARDIRQAAPASKPLNELLNQARQSLGLRRPVQLRLTERPMSPAACGLLRPVILLPRSLGEQLPPSQLRAVLLHELIHLRRGDVWVNCAQALLQLLYWWHPLLWLANARIRQVREEAVDDGVMLALREDAETYAPTLLEVARLALRRPLTSLGLVGILESRTSLRQRIQRLLDFHPPRKAGLTLASALTVAAFAATAVPMGQAPAPVERGTSNTTRLLSAGPEDQLYTFSDPTLTNSAVQPSKAARPQVMVKTTFIEVPEADANAFLRGPLATGETNRLGTVLLSTQQASDLLASLKAKPGVSVVDERNLAIQSGANGQIAVKSAEPVEQTTPEVPALDPDNPEARHYWNRLAAAHQATAPFYYQWHKGTNLGGATSVAPQVFAANGTSALAYQWYHEGTNASLPASAPPQVYAIVETAPLGYQWSAGGPNASPATSAPPQLHLKATFIEVPEAEAAAFRSRFAVTNAPGAATWSTKLTSAQAADQLAQWKSGPGKVLSSPAMTTLSGRQCQLSVQELVTVVTLTNSVLQSNAVPLGSIVDLTPTVGADGYTIQLDITASQTEFLGYQRPPSGDPSILPQFRKREFTSSASVLDSQTLVLGGPVAESISRVKGKVPLLGDVPYLGPLFRSESASTRKMHLLLLVTPTLVDSAGNPVHSEKELRSLTAQKK